MSNEMEMIKMAEDKNKQSSCVHYFVITRKTRMNAACIEETFETKTCKVCGMIKTKKVLE